MSDATSKPPRAVPYDATHGATAPSDTWVLAALLDDRLVTFTRVVGSLRRRRLAVGSVAVGGAAAAGLSRLTVLLHADAPTAARAVEYLRRIVGVRDAAAFPARPQTTRELALIKVRVPSAGAGELLAVAHRHACAVVSESAEAVVFEVSGPGPSVGSCLAALRRFGVLDVARTGTVAVDAAAAVPFHIHEQAE